VENRLTVLASLENRLTVEEQLRATRLTLKIEANKVRQCITPAEKRDLVAYWNSRFSPQFVKELIGMAKDRRNCEKIAQWDLDKLTVKTNNFTVRTK
jgi:hypothetical protein